MKNLICHMQHRHVTCKSTGRHIYNIFDILDITGNTGKNIKKLFFILNNKNHRQSQVCHKQIHRQNLCERLILGRVTGNTGKKAYSYYKKEEYI